jgi:hypothetical protein
MWLRDSLPRDLPETRILVYGQDTRLHKSESFQNTKDLGIQLRNSISNIRSCLYVSQKPKALSLLMKSQESNTLRPLLLLGHSLGGIIIKQVSSASLPFRIDLNNVSLGID